MGLLGSGVLGLSLGSWDILMVFFYIGSPTAVGFSYTLMAKPRWLGHSEGQRFHDTKVGESM